MADKSISELVAASQVGSTDLFVLEQGNVAKKLTGQILENWLVSMAEGHGGIISITKTGTSGLTDTYTITLSDETTTTFTVTNGQGIKSVTKTAAVPPSLTDTYTITYTDNSTYQFTVNNGKSISSVVPKWAVSNSNTTAPTTWYNTMQTMTATNRYLWSYQIITMNDNTTIETTKTVVGVYGDTGSTWNVWIRYAASQPTSDADITTTPNAWIGIYSGVSPSAPSSYQAYTWYQYKGQKGDKGSSVSSVSKTGSSGLVDTYTMTMSDGTSYTFDVTNGSSIANIEKTSTSGLTDTYTVTETDGSTSTFEVKNGRSIVSITQTGGTHAAGTTDTYTITYNDGDTSTFTVYNGANGTGAVSTVAGIGVTGSSGDVPLILWDNGAPTPTTVGQLKQLYYDLSGGVMYICIGVGSTYSWASMGITVDEQLSTSSSNPVRNSTITNKVGTIALSTTAQNLSGAVNELHDGKANKTAAVSTIRYNDNNNHKLQKTINGTTTDVMTVDTEPTDGSMNPITSDAVYDLKGSLNTKLIKLTATLNSSVTSATIASWSNQTGITENSFVVEAKFSNPSAILSNITVTKDTGSVVLTGTTGASAGTIELIMGNE